MRLWLLTHRATDNDGTFEDHCVSERMDDLLAEIIEHWGPDVARTVYRALEDELIDVATGMIRDAIGKKFFPNVLARVKVPAPDGVSADEELEVLTIDTADRPWFGCLEVA